MRNYDELKTLNAEQRRAAETIERQVLIVAGPGTGKTKTLTARIAYLLAGGHATASEVIALTFTNKAAREMRERLGGMLREHEALPKITTFHSAGHELLRQSGDARLLLTELERREIVRSLVKPPAFRSMGVNELGLLISQLKTTVNPLRDTSEKTLLDRYEQKLTGKHRCDFDDLLVSSVAMLRADDTKRYAYVLVDEFQDTSELQYEMLRLLASRAHLFAIGDPHQSIYAFRGAGASMFDRFRQDFPYAAEIALSSNYRSRREVVAVANAVFPNSSQLIAESGGGGAVHVMQTLNEYSEAAYVVREIERGIGGSDLISGNIEEFVREPRDYAVLYRTHRAGRVLQETFEKAGIPYQIAGEGSPYERPEVQAVISLLRYLYRPDQTELPKIRRSSDHQVRAFMDTAVASDARNPMNVCEYIPYFAEAFGIDFGTHLQQVQSRLVQFGRDIGAALKHIDDIAEGEFYDPTVNAVTLMTIHAAKGLEFSHVFVVAAEEGIVPKLDASGNGDIEEERRLFYVAVTRAREVLELLCVKARTGVPATASRFIESIDEETLPRTNDPGMPMLEKRQKKRTAKRAQTSLF